MGVHKGIQKGDFKIPIIYKINILNALKEQGLSSYRLRKENLLSEGAIQSLRTNKMISLDSVGRICGLLDCQPGDILAYKKNEEK